jgi:hypothetical protein
MQCTCCREERENLREYSVSAVDAKQRKTILTLQLCPMCRVLYRIKPRLVAERIARATPQRRIA